MSKFDVGSPLWGKVGKEGTEGFPEERPTVGSRDREGPAGPHGLRVSGLL